MSIDVNVLLRKNRNQHSGRTENLVNANCPNYLYCSYLAQFLFDGEIEKKKLHSCPFLGRTMKCTHLSNTTCFKLTNQIGIFEEVHHWASS